MLTPASLTRQAFWYLRHGETDWNARNLSQGTIDIPLNETGRAQAVAASKLLRGRGIRSIVSSPLSRALDTAQAAAAEIGCEVTLDEGLREVEFGEQEGLPMGHWYDDWIAGTYTPARAETFAALKARAIGGINLALERESPVLVVAHGALFRAVRAAMGLEPNVRTPNAMPIFCEPGAGPSDPWVLTPAVPQAG